MKQQQWWYRHTCFTSPTHVLTHTPPSSILQVHSNNTSALLPWQPIFSLTGRISVFGTTHTKKVRFSVIQKPFNNRMCRFRTKRNATQWSGDGRGEYIDYKNFTDRQKSITFPHLSEAQEQRMKRLEHEGEKKLMWKGLKIWRDLRARLFRTNTSKQHESSPKSEAAIKPFCTQGRLD